MQASKSYADFVDSSHYEEIILFVVIWQMIDDGESAVILLHEEQSYHLVGEGHGR